MSHISAFSKSVISVLRTHKSQTAVVLALIALAFAGCGSSDKQAVAPTPVVTGATQSTTPQVATPITSATPQTPPAANPNDSGAGDEEAARTGIEVGLKNGGFTRATARRVHVPSYIAIELDVTVEDSETYNLVINSGALDRTITYNKPGSYKLTIKGLRPKQTATVVLGGEQEIKITADAEPGP